MIAVNRLLDRLDGVRQTAPGKWRARCPAHGSKAQSVAIADADGRVLIHAFCGCETATVLSAVGLTVSDLFDGKISDSKGAARSPWSARDVLDLVLVEINVVVVVATDMLDRRTIGDTDWRRLSQAAGRLNGIANTVRA